ncbi:MAG TPA: hypothetical protein VIP77_16225 [Jiangellaceae bacterium]
MDQGRGREALGVSVRSGLPEGGHGTTAWRIDRWDAEQTAWVRQRGGLVAPQGVDFARLGVRPYKVSEHLGNVITTAGWTRMLNLLIGAGGQIFDAAHTRIGAGNGTTSAGGGSVPAVAADTDLAAAAGSGNRWFQLAAGIGVVGGTVPKTLTITATFASADGNFAWNEFGIDQGTASGNTVTATLLNHATSIAQGTKVAGQTWTATAVLSFT